MPAQRNSISYIMAFVTLSIAALFLLFPGDSFRASIRGLAIWWDVLFPALFPFLVISETMLGLGIVHFLGTLLDPMMRPVFRVPGIGGFIMAMGFASGYPVGARLSSQMWEQHLINRDEGERLISFTSTSDPIFLIGAVSVGFFHDPALAGILAIAHYGAGILVGVLMRFHGNPETALDIIEKPKGSILKRAVQALYLARKANGLPFGKLLEEAVQSSLKLIFVIGGLVVFFSVVLEVLGKVKVIGLFHMAIGSALQWFGMSETLSQAIVNGFFEVTLGAQAAGAADHSIALKSKVAVAAFILSWSGLSVHAQIVSLIHHTGMRYLPFLIARIIHGLLAAIIVILLWDEMLPLSQTIGTMVPVFRNANDPADFFTALPSLWAFSAFVFLGMLLLIPFLFLFFSLFQRCIMKWF